MMKFKVMIVVVTLASIVVESCAQISGEEYMDSVINLLLNGDNFENIPSSEDTFSDEQTYDNGLWRCGNCDIVDERNIIHAEINNIEENGLDDVPHDVQVGLDLEGMLCVTVAANSRPNIRIVSGSCAGARVTLAVSNAQEFIVRVYGK